MIDTNTVLDWLLFNDPRVVQLATAVQEGAVSWITCPRMRDEFERTLTYATLARWSPDAEALLAAFDRWTLPIDHPPPCPISGLLCSDPDDQVFLDLAVANRAVWLVTHDRALLRLARRAKAAWLTIVDPARWPAP